MRDKNYYLLIEKLNAKDEMERLMIINSRIDEIIFKSSYPKRALEALMCMFEGRNNVATCYAILAIAYSTCVGAVSMWATCSADTVYVAKVLGVVTVIIAVIAYFAYKRDEKRAFILMALKIRYENMDFQAANNYTQERIHNDEENEKEYIVKINKK